METPRSKTLLTGETGRPRVRAVNLVMLPAVKIPTSEELDKWLNKAGILIKSKDGGEVLGLHRMSNVTIECFLDDFIRNIEGRVLNGLQVLTAWDSSKAGHIHNLSPDLNVTLEMWFGRVIDTVVPSSIVASDAKILRDYREGVPIEGKERTRLDLIQSGYMIRDG